MSFLEKEHFKTPAHKAWIGNIQSMIDTMRVCNPAYTGGQISDGYHTFDELYHHRALLLAALINTPPWNNYAWKSLHHHYSNDPMEEGMFIVGIDTPFGQATYHYDLAYWSYFDCKELDRAPEYDGHNSEDAINRIFNMSKGIILL